MEILIIALIIQQVIFVAVLLYVLKALKDFLKEVLIILKSKDVYEAKEVLEQKPPEPKEEIIPFEDLPPEQALRLLNEELKKQAEI